MKKSKTQQRIDEATANLRRDLGAYQEAFWCLRAGKIPVAFQSGEDENLVTVEALGADRASGGVVILGPSVFYATDWLQSARNSPDPYTRDLAHKVERAQSDVSRSGRIPPPMRKALESEHDASPTQLVQEGVADFNITRIE